ncbi:MucR family transcriptional regulator [Streptomyces sp. NBRC 109706]|uniref:MucR family transcriptional regulator n=1 Tax=Streptomyces sp. NBRC 109706 TaxID=1550035 RepID=UPI000783AC1F|nr:MucR family transcriptional regulator [Streptomyces sp. NBRC 109706]
MHYGDRDGYGQYGILDDDGERVLCHECGRRYRQLPYHINRAHGMTAVEYRAAHGLSVTQPLASDSLTATQRANSTRVYAQRPDIRAMLADALSRGCSAAASRAAQAAAPDSLARAAERHRRRVASARLAERERAAKRRRLDEAARAHGYADIDAWLTDHADLTASQIREVLGVSGAAARELRRGVVSAQRPSALAKERAIDRVIDGEQLRAVAPDAGVGPDALRAWVVASPQGVAAATAAGYADAGTWLTERSRVNADMRRAAVDVVSGGESKAAVARRLGVSDVAVGKWVRAAGHRQRLEPGIDTTPQSTPPASTREVERQRAYDEIRRLWLTGMTLQQIGLQVDRSPSSVSHAARRLGLPPRLTRASDESIQRVRELWPDRSLTTDEIARQVGVSRASVSYIAHQLGLPRRRAKERLRGEQLRTARARLPELWMDESLSLPAIAQRLGVGSSPTLSRWAREMGLPPRSRGRKRPHPKSDR